MMQPRILAVSAVLALVAKCATASPVPEPDPAAPMTRRILVWGPSKPSAETLAARDAVLARAAGAPLFQALGLTHRTGPVQSAGELLPAPGDRKVWKWQGLDNLVVVGTPAEGDVAARVKGFTYGIDTGRKELYRFGFGRFTGDVGCVETGFNPWLYSDRFDDNPYSTLLVRISGTTPTGVLLAARAFLDGMNNGIVLGAGARNAEQGLLCRVPSSTPPPKLPPRFVNEDGGILAYAGWSQVPEQDFRALLDYGAPREPVAMWRIKYLATGALDDCSGAAWVRGPAPMAWGNAVTLAFFDDDACAEAAWKGVREACRDRAESKVSGRSAFSVPMPVDGISQVSLGRVTYWTHGRWLVMSSLPEATHAAMELAIGAAPVPAKP